VAVQVFLPASAQSVRFRNRRTGAKQRIGSRDNLRLQRSLRQRRSDAAFSLDMSPIAIAVYRW
jgi:hypothetical protein